MVENNEKHVCPHLAGVAMGHSGRQYIRQVGDYFDLEGTHGKHEVFVMEALGMSLRTLQEQQESRVFPEILVVNAIDQVLRGLDFLHEANVIHTGEYACNSRLDSRPWPVLLT